MGGNRRAGAFDESIAVIGRERAKALRAGGAVRPADLDFVHRIIAQHGLFYWFEHPADAWEGEPGSSKHAQETVVFGDDPTAYAPISGASGLTSGPK